MFKNMSNSERSQNTITDTQPSGIRGPIDTEVQMDGPMSQQPIMNETLTSQTLQREPTLGVTRAQQLMSIVKDENKTLEEVNLGLITKLQQNETKLVSLMSSLATKDTQLQQNKDALNKAEQVIKRLTNEMLNMRRQTDFNERQVITLKEQYQNLQSTYNLQERDIQSKVKTLESGEQLRLELRNTIEQMNSMKRLNLLEMDQEKDKYQDLLHRHSDLQRSYDSLKLMHEAKDEECLTLSTHNEIQKKQVISLQDEISSMLDKLEHIKSFYEIELEQRVQQLQNQRSNQVSQMKILQNQMRQDQVNNFKQIVQIKQECEFKAPEPVKKKDK